MDRLSCRRLLSPSVAALAVAGLAGAAGPASANDAPAAVVALVLDTSGSVTAAGLARSRELAVELLEGLPVSSEFAVLTFDDESRVVLPRTSRPEEVRAALDALRISGRRTALHDALFDAGRQLAQATGQRRAIVLLTDGRDTDSALEIEDGLRLATDAGIPVFAVGVGRTQERLLRRIAKLTGGEYVRGEDASGGAIAGRIAALDRVPPAPAEAAVPAPPVTARVETAAPPIQAPAPAGRLSWVGLGVAALVPVAGVALLVMRRRSRSRCPACGRARPPGGECSTCPPRDRVVDADLSPTVLARLSATEEYLDKTVTLRERPVLAVTRGPALGQTYDLSLQSATSLGRAKVNDIVLPDVAVSSEHCRVRPEDGRFVLHDLKSTNGTYVNERRVTRPLSLSEGDVIKIGETSLQYRTEQRRA